MDPGRFSTSVCVLMVCLLGTTRLSSVGQCACPEIPRRSLTLPPEGKNCFNVSDKYRYTCIPGYVRKAGTSNLIKCNNHSQWTTTKFPLECIPHPDSTPTPPHIPDGSSITTAATNRPGTSTSHPTGRSSTTETTSSANMEEQSTSAADTRTIAATLSVVILLVSMSGIIFVLHRRRKRPIPPQETEEMQPMNNPS
ncbi:interleukin-15 receptor subunit alpha isoform X3 [Xiphophorus couchianus]|uniref:interleukin-15 receptor subunit alpha isoform X3 n=1 Tax=Xiphophorus couchianus TaxID=32473 RepID=UPI00101603A6|nr:interleukin-15 receptor subunit alpha isoform X3 [Xiphophorus couchianus]